METPPGGGVRGSFFAGYVQLVSQILCCILAYVVANYRSHLCPLLGRTGMEWEPFIKYILKYGNPLFFSMNLPVNDLPYLPYPLLPLPFSELIFKW